MRLKLLRRGKRGLSVILLPWLPNFRDSTGYGKKFLNAGNEEWGTVSMRHDITDGVEYLIKDVIADSKRIGISGDPTTGMPRLRD